MKVLEWVMRKKGIPKALVGSVRILYDGAKTRVIVDSELLEELKAKVRMHQGFVSSSFLSSVVVHVVKLAKQRVLSELLLLLYADGTQE